MAEIGVVVLVLACFVIGALWNRNNFGSRQDVLRMFNRFRSISHQHAYEFMKDLPSRPLQ